MAIINLPSTDSYWWSLQIYNNFLLKIIKKNRYRLLVKIIQIPDNDEEKDIENENKKYGLKNI